jgi:hypothetical protein
MCNHLTETPEVARTLQLLDRMVNERFFVISKGLFARS